MSRFWSEIKGRKTPLKYWSSHTPPQPARHASVENTSYGEVHLAMLIIDTPLYSRKNRRHHNKSFRNPAVKFSWWWLCLSLPRRARIHAIKTRLWCTHLETNTNLPTRDCRADFVAVRLVSHCSNNWSISQRRSELTDSVKLFVCSWTPKQIITGEGEQDFSSDSWSPSHVNKSPSTWKSVVAVLGGETPIKSIVYYVGN